MTAVPLLFFILLYCFIVRIQGSGDTEYDLVKRYFPKISRGSPDELHLAAMERWDMSDDDTDPLRPFNTRIQPPIINVTGSEFSICNYDPHIADPVETLGFEPQLRHSYVFQICIPYEQPRKRSIILVSKTCGWYPSFAIYEKNTKTGTYEVFHVSSKDANNAMYEFKEGQIYLLEIGNIDRKGIEDVTSLSPQDVAKGIEGQFLLLFSDGKKDNLLPFRNKTFTGPLSSNPSTMHTCTLEYGGKAFAEESGESEDWGTYDRSLPQCYDSERNSLRFFYSQGEASKEPSTRGTPNRFALELQFTGNGKTNFNGITNICPNEKVLRVMTVEVNMLLDYFRRLMEAEQRCKQLKRLKQQKEKERNVRRQPILKNERDAPSTDLNSLEIRSEEPKDNSNGKGSANGDVPRRCPFTGRVLAANEPMPTTDPALNRPIIAKPNDAGLVNPMMPNVNNSYGNVPYNGNPYGNVPYSGNPYGIVPYNDNPYGNPPYNNATNSNSPSINPFYNNVPFANDQYNIPHNNSHSGNSDSGCAYTRYSPAANSNPVSDPIKNHFTNGNNSQYNSKVTPPINDSFQAQKHPYYPYQPINPYPSHQAQTPYNNAPNSMQQKVLESIAFGFKYQPKTSLPPPPLSQPLPNYPPRPLPLPPSQYHNLLIQPIAIKPIVALPPLSSPLPYNSNPYNSSIPPTYPPVPPSYPQQFTRPLNQPNLPAYNTPPFTPFNNQHLSPATQNLNLINARVRIKDGKPCLCNDSYDTIKRMLSNPNSNPNFFPISTVATNSAILKNTPTDTSVNLATKFATDIKPPTADSVVYPDKESEFPIVLTLF